MKNINKTIKILLLFFALPFIISFLDSCIFPKESPIYKIESMLISSQRILGIDSVGDRNQHIVYEVQDLSNILDTIAIRYDSLGFFISIESILASRVIRNIGFQPLYAWSRIKDYENIDHVTITSDKDYDLNHPAGTNLTDLVSFHIGHLIRDYTVSQFEQDNLYSGTSEFFIKFIAAPTQVELHTIFLTFLTEENNKFEFEVENIQIYQ